ncbi:MAG TPA: hypothetical protein VKB96_11535 [Gammaproteobacteria bacterium]|nr:hypothetical protein [Gammaproteobacteria bacterium]
MPEGQAVDMRCNLRGIALQPPAGQVVMMQHALKVSYRVVFPDALNDCLAVRFPVACQGADEGVC